MRKIWIPQAIVSAVLLWALYPKNPYAYYILLRWICCGIFGYLTVHALEKERRGWAWTLGVTALIYNPILRVHLTRELWSIVNIATMGIAIVSIIFLPPVEKT